jgi:hypothetical protein
VLLLLLLLLLSVVVVVVAVVVVVVVVGEGGCAPCGQTGAGRSTVACALSPHQRGLALVHRSPCPLASQPARL